MAWLHELPDDRPLIEFARENGLAVIAAYRPGTSYMIVMLRPVETAETFKPAPSGEWCDFLIQTDESRTLELCRLQR